MGLKRRKDESIKLWKVTEFEISARKVQSFEPRIDVYDFWDYARVFDIWE